MDSEEKLKIRKMRSQGETYARIAEIIGLSMNTVKSFCRRNELKCLDLEDRKTKDTCKNCNKKLIIQEKQKLKIFCSDACRFKWWNKNRDKMDKKATCIIKCKHCRKKFEGYINIKRLFCSHSCYISYRYNI